MGTEDPRGAVARGGRARTPASTTAGLSIARVVGVDGGGAPLVREDAEPDFGREAAEKVEVAWMPAPPVWSDCVGCRVVLARVPGATPVLVALLDAPRPAARAPAVPAELAIEAGRSLIIRCGRARIELRADGRVTIDGTYVLSRSSGPNKVKGGSVEIN